MGTIVVVLYWDVYTGCTLLDILCAVYLFDLIIYSLSFGLHHDHDCFSLPSLFLSSLPSAVSNV